MSNINRRRVVITSGYFNPLHIGHVQYLEAAAAASELHVVIVNSDFQVALKGSVPFMGESERLVIVGSLVTVDDHMLAVDKDATVCESIRAIYRTLNDGHTDFVFANGGDRTQRNIPEGEICKALGIAVEFGFGGEKVQSSSKLISNAIYERSRRTRQRTVKHGS